MADRSRRSQAAARKPDPEDATPGPSDRETPAWDAATWEGARQATFESALKATPAQRLDWLEEALELLRQARRAGPPRRPD